MSDSVEVFVILRTADGCERGRAPANMRVDGLTVHVMQLETIPVPDADLHDAELLLIATDGTDLMRWSVPSNATVGDSISVPSTLTMT